MRRIKRDGERARELLAAGECTCAMVKGDVEWVSGERGVTPLLRLCTANRARGFCAADKIVGRAAAFLYVLMGVRYVYASVLSQGAEEIFTEHGIAYDFEVKTDTIINRDGTDICPMERAVLGITDPKEALNAILHARAQLRTVKGAQ